MLANIVNWFTEEWVVNRLTTEDDDWGNPVEAWNFSHTIFGRFRPLSGDRKLSADKQTEFADGKLYCATGSDIFVGDRIQRNGETYEVLFVQNPMSMDKFLQVEVKFIELEEGS
jgi:SPP1 family predicted phage head-tail adaptor